MPTRILNRVLLGSGIGWLHVMCRLFFLAIVSNVKLDPEGEDKPDQPMSAERVNAVVFKPFVAVFT